MEGVVSVPVIIYRSIRGFIEEIDIKWWKSFAAQLGLKFHEHTTANTTTITVCQGAKTASFTMYRLGSKLEITLDYLRLEPKETMLAELVDYLIHHLKLSGEKHIIDSGQFIGSTFFDEGKVVKKHNDYSDHQFEQYLLKEIIFGKVHLALDHLVIAQHLGDSETVQKIKDMINNYQKQLEQIDEQLRD